MLDIVICDSGIAKRYVGEIETYGEDNVLDENGHGSQIFEMLKCIDNRLKIGSIKILDEYREGTAEDLINALEYCKNVNTKVVLLALALEADIYIEALEKVIEELKSQGKIIVSAVMNDREKSLPAAYSNVIGVKKSETVKYSFCRANTIQCEIRMNPIICETNYNNRFDTFLGNSMFAAFVAGIIASHFIDKEISWTEVEDYLENPDFLGFLEFVKNMKSEKMRKILYDNVINSCEKISEYVNPQNLLQTIDSIEKLNLLLEDLKNKGMKINQKSIFYVDYMRNIDSLVNYFGTQERQEDV